jgi:spore germination protein GerM
MYDRLNVGWLLAALVLLIVACGDDDDDDADSATATPSVEVETPTSETTTEPTSDEGEAVINLSLFYPRATETGFELVEVERQIPDTPLVGTEALVLLIDGPTVEEENEHDISNPIPEGTELLSLEIEDGVATADFSEELLDFGGGSLNVQTITAMIEETLKQFPTVDEVVILVEGQPDALQP